MGVTIILIMTFAQFISEVLNVPITFIAFKITIFDDDDEIASFNTCYTWFTLKKREKCHFFTLEL